MPLCQRSVDVALDNGGGDELEAIDNVQGKV